jgi:hypothetical protein
VTRWIASAALGLVLGAAALVAAAENAEPTPRPTAAQKSFSDEDLKRYATPRPRPGEGQAAGGQGSASGGGPQAVPTSKHRHRKWWKPVEDDAEQRKGRREEGAPPPPSRDDTAAASPGSSDPGTSSEPSSGKSIFEVQKEWRDRADQMQGKVHSAKVDLMRRERDLENANRVLTMGTDMVEIIRARQDKAELEAEAERARAAVEEAERQLADFEKQAALENVPHGWIEPRE